MASKNSEVDALFQLALPEFTAARNALASQLQKAGDKEAAATVKSLAKPPVSAWAVNQLFWRNREAFDRLLTAGARLRQAQASQLAGHVTNLRELLTTHRATLTELSRQAATILSESGHQPSPDVMRRVTMTLEGLAAQGLLDGAPAAGRLTADVDPPGFETISALAPRPAGDKPARDPGDGRVLAFRANQRVAANGKGKHKAIAGADAKARDAERRKAAQAALKAAERALTEARRDAATAEAALKKAAAKLKDAEKDKKDLEARLEKAGAAAETARQAARKTASEAADAAQVVEDAERAVEKAREEL
ncbi:MAG TPA: hypothetical protein VGQ37_24675 [Vicinamibacterales bacterium]|nr:hypothetical protein [Vicinamibacterales bacterium]